MEEAEFKRALACPAFPHPLEVFGAIGAALPFFLNFTTSSTHSLNGVVVEAVTRNWVALAGGALAVLVGVWSLALARSTRDEERGKRRSAGLALVGVGLLQLIVRGGLLG